MQCLITCAEEYKEPVQKAVAEAEKWEAHGGLNSDLTLYAFTTEDLITTWPVGIREQLNHIDSLRKLQKEQSAKVCSQLEILIAMNFLQRARLESWASKDNWAGDALGGVENNIKSLVQCHDMLLTAHTSQYY